MCGIVSKASSGSGDMEQDWIFDEIEVSAEPFAFCEVGPRDKLFLPREEKAVLHYVLSGTGEIRIADHPTIAIAAGAVVLIPAMMKHSLHGEGGGTGFLSTCQPAALGLAHHLSSDSASDTLQILCGRVSVGLRRAMPVIDLLQKPVISPARGEELQARALSLFVQELANPRLGSRAIVRVLLLECVINILRDRLSTDDPEMTWLSALIDRRLWPALNAMLETPNAPHSVESLADTVGMSRSRFAERFAQAYGSGPMHLLRNLRMHLAARLLTTTDLGVDRIAERTGFASRSYFSHQFEIYYGKSPGRFRREMTGSPPRLT